MKIKKLRILLLLLPCLYLMSSCRSTKQLTLFQKISASESDSVNIPEAYHSLIQTGDILAINVTSLSTSASSFFNPYAVMGGNNGTTPIGVDESPGYLVDQTGSIELPLIGSLQLSGLTTLQAKDLIKQNLTKYLKEPTITVRIVNYKITLLGEISKPAVYTIPNERVTLPEIISMGGDITAFGRRDNILIVRENNGKKEFGHVNLNTRDVYNSPYYYLRSNDLVYIEPTAGKSVQNSSFFRVFTILASAASLIIVLITRL
jgi:polysaccharide export outer membrane protein